MAGNVLPSGAVKVLPIVCGLIFRLGKSGASWRRRVDRRRRARGLPGSALPRSPERLISWSRSVSVASAAFTRSRSCRSGR
jgi:hypothetical protein